MASSSPAVTQSLLASHQQAAAAAAGAPTVGAPMPAYLAAAAASPQAAASSLGYRPSAVGGSALASAAHARAPGGAAAASIGFGAGSMAPVVSNPSCRKEYTATRRYFVSITASPAAAAANPDVCQWCLRDAYAIKYRGNRGEQGGERFGDPRNAVLLGAKLYYAHSTFPVPVIVGSNLIRGNLYTNTGLRGFWASIPNKMQTFPKGFRIHFAHRSAYSPIMSAYDDLTESHLNALEIEGKRVVKLGSHIWNVITGNRAKIETRMQKMGMPTRTLEDMIASKAVGLGAVAFVPEAIFQSAASSLRRKVLQAAPYQDLLGFSVTLKRADGGWGDPMPYYANSGAELQAMIRSSSCCFYAMIELTYRLKGHGISAAAVGSQTKA